jgi:hypothetical protein
LDISNDEKQKALIMCEKSEWYKKKAERKKIGKNVEIKTPKEKMANYK